MTTPDAPKALQEEIAAMEAVMKADTSTENTVNPALAVEEAPFVPEPIQATAPEPTPEPTQAPEPETFQPVNLRNEPPAGYVPQHTHEVLQNKYNKEVPRYAQEVKGLKQENQELRERLEAAEQASQVYQGQEYAQDTSELEEDMPEVAQLYRSLSFKDQVKRDSEMADIKEKLEYLESLNEKSVSESFWSALDQAHPDNSTICQTPEFAAWLEQPVSDLIPDETRKDVLFDARDRFDATTAAKVFTAYKQSLSGDYSVVLPSIASQAQPNQLSGGFSVPTPSVSPEEASQILDEMLQNYSRYTPEQREAKLKIVNAATT